MSYRCVAYGCKEGTGAAAKIMCRRHWHALPGHLRGDVQSAARPGLPWISQDFDYQGAVEKAVRYVWRAERESRQEDVCASGDFFDHLADIMDKRDAQLPPPPPPPPADSVTLTGRYVKVGGERAFQTEDKTWIDCDAIILLRQAMEAALRLRDAVEAQDMGLRLPSSMSSPPEPGSYRALLADFDRQVHAIEGRTGHKLRSLR